jgi:hypothetical protein
MLIRDRIKDFRRVPAHSLLPNPKNWRIHTARQRNVLQGILAEIGYADALLARELSDGVRRVFSSAPPKSVPIYRIRQCDSPQ